MTDPVARILCVTLYYSLYPVQRQHFLAHAREAFRAMAEQEPETCSAGLDFLAVIEKVERGPAERKG